MNWKKRDAYMTWCRQCESNFRRESGIKTAQWETEVTAMREDFDQNLMLLNLRNGTLDLETGHYTLTGGNEAHCFWRLIRPGANGKSTMLDVLERVMGDFGTLLQSLITKLLASRLIPLTRYRRMVTVRTPVLTLFGGCLELLAPTLAEPRAS